MDKYNNIRRWKNLTLWIILLPLVSIACGLTIPNQNTDVITPTETEPVIVIEETSTLAPHATVTLTTQTKQSVIHENVDEQDVLIDLYAKINPAVVNITTYIIENGEVYPNSQGSGFLFDTEGNIVTNAHVVHGANQVDVAFSEGTVRPAEVIGEDLHSDLAVLDVDLLPPGIEPIPLGDINDVVVGQTVVAIGNPFGLGGTLTKGIISALGRTIPALTSFSIPKSIQTDAAINPGNSGGPLLNLDGEVIGVNAQIQTDGITISNQGIGFAIPVNIVERVVPELAANGFYNWAWLGVRGTDMSPNIAEAMGADVERGAYLSSIIENGPASSAGLHGSVGTERVNGRITPVGGDVIIAVNGSEINSFDDLLIYIALESNPGEVVTLTIWRNGELTDVTLKLEPRPDTIEDMLP